MKITEKEEFKDLKKEIEKAKDKIYDMCCDVLDSGCYDSLTMEISLMLCCGKVSQKYRLKNNINKYKPDIKLCLIPQYSKTDVISSFYYETK
jgi:hypothetical protein